jgi:hypothetical protein
MALAFSAPGGRCELIGAGGTSAGAPFWADLDPVTGWGTPDA